MNYDEASAAGYEMVDVAGALHRMKRLQEAYQRDNDPNPAIAECMAILQVFRWCNRQQ